MFTGEGANHGTSPKPNVIFLGHPTTFELSSFAFALKLTPK